MTSSHGSGGDDRTRDEELSYSALFRRYLPYTRRLLWLRGVPKEDRDDLVQEAWLRVYTSLDRYDPERLFEPWLRAIVVRTACDYFKQAIVRRERVSETGEVEPRGASRMEERMIDASRTLEAALGQLSDEHREVFVLGEIEEMEAKEIAGVLGVPVNTVYSRLSRAREQFTRAVDRLRSAEERRLGAAFVVPAFLVDWRVLVEHGREIPPVSAGTANAIWDGVVRGIQGFRGDAGSAEGGHGVDHGDAPPSVPSQSLAPPPPLAASPAASLPSALARLPWLSPSGLGAALILGGVGGGTLVYGWVREPAAPRPAVASEVPSSTTLASGTAQAATASALAGGNPSVTAASSTSVPAPPSGSTMAYDPREELATLEAAWALYFQGKCTEARAKLGTRTGRVHAKDYTELRTKLATCVGRDGGAP